MGALDLGAPFTLEGAAMALTLESLLDLLGPEPRPVAELWKALGVERKALAAFVAAHWGELVAAGVEPQGATKSHGRLTQYIEVEGLSLDPRRGRRVAALSLPVVALAVVAPAPLAVRGTLAEAARAADTAAAGGVFESYRGKRADETLRAQDGDLARWSRYLAAVGVAGADCAWSSEPECWSDVSWGVVEGFIRWQAAEGYSLSSIARALSTVRTYAAQAARAGALAPDALRLIQTVEAPAPRSREGRNADAQRATTRRPDAKKAAPVRLTAAQARALKRSHPDTPQGRRDALLMCLLIDHGLRISEAAELKVTDLDLTEGLMTFYRRKVDRTDTHKLEPDTLRAARHYFDAGDAPAAGPLLRTVERRGADTLGGPLSVQGARELVARLGHRVGLSGLSPHDLRHYAATVRARLFRDPFALQEWGGWASIATARRYVERAAIANAGSYIGEEEE